MTSFLTQAVTCRRTHNLYSNDFVSEIVTGSISGSAECLESAGVIHLSGTISSSGHGACSSSIACKINFCRNCGGRGQDTSPTVSNIQTMLVVFKNVCSI